MKKLVANRPYRWFIATVFTILMSLCHKAIAGETYLMPSPGNDLIGGMQEIYIEPGDTISKIAIRHGIGYTELVKANPDINPRRMKPWSKLTIPSAYILPPGERKGIVINLSEMRLYYYSPHDDTVMTAPVAIGRQGWETPLTTTKIIAKEENPAWHVPKSIRAYSEAKGIILPKVMPPGPDNPLGDHVLRLSLNAYLIHGTNRPNSIGKPISSGCIRMYPDDISELYYEVPIGTHVRIINHPYKVGWHDGALYLEAHIPVKNGEEQLASHQEDYTAMIDSTVNQQYHGAYIDWQRLHEQATRHTGIPERIY